MPERQVYRVMLNEVKHLIVISYRSGTRNGNPNATPTVNKSSLKRAPAPLMVL
jgi:hypothetical protein